MSTQETLTRSHTFNIAYVSQTEMSWYNVTFIDDFGLIKRGTTFDVVSLHPDGHLEAFHKERGDFQRIPFSIRPLEGA